MEGLFSTIGKMALVVLAAGLLVGGGYYLAVKYGSGAKGPMITSMPTVSVAPTATANVATPTAVPLMPVATPTPLRTINGGLPKSASLSFFPYTVTYPTDWQVSRQGDPQLPTDKLVLSKDGYQLSIYQAASGGAQCVYPGEASPEGPAIAYQAYVEFAGNDKITYRRGTVDSTNLATQNFEICSRVQNVFFSDPTPMGHILYQAPKAYDGQVLGEMDKIVASLTRVI